MKKAAIALIVIIVGGFLVGFTVGKLTSPDYSDKVTIMKFVYSHIQSDIEDGNITYSLTCGATVFTYASASDTVLTSNLNPLAVQNLPSRPHYKTMNLNMMYSIFGGGPVTAFVGGYKFLDYLTPLTRNQKVAFGIFAVLTTASGVYWGYRLGYSNTIDCSADMVQRVLMDKSIWRDYAEYRRRTAIGILQQ